jgi:hypothetical protein
MPAPTRHALTPAFVHFFTRSLAFFCSFLLFSRVNCVLNHTRCFTQVQLPDPAGLVRFFSCTSESDRVCRL